MNKEKGSFYDLLVRVSDWIIEKPYPLVIPVVILFIVAVFQNSEMPDIPELNIIQYSDVSVSDRYYDAIQYVCENKMMEGVSESEFEPDSIISGSEILFFLTAFDQSYENNDSIIESGEITYDILSKVLNDYLKENNLTLMHNDSENSNNYDSGRQDPFVMMQMACIIPPKREKDSFVTRAEAAFVFENFVKSIERSGNYKIGKTILMGKIEQDNNAKNGPEEIEWKVLDIDGDKALVISKDGIIASDFCEGGYAVTWETSSIRQLLNEEFYQNAFSIEDQKRILSVTVSNDENPKYKTDTGNATIDKIFLLSAIEADQYFENDDARRAAPSQLIYEEYGDYLFDYEGIMDKGRVPVSHDWWLRTQGPARCLITFVTFDGSIWYNGTSARASELKYARMLCVRPAMWIDITEFKS